MKVVYRVTRLNGKICVGSDLGDSITYFSDVDKRHIDSDLTHARGSARHDCAARVRVGIRYRDG